MSDMLKPIDIVYTARHATLQAKNMHREADELERSAKNQRIRATERVIEGFEYANSHLVAAWQSGEFSDQELLRAQLELREADPLIHRATNEPSTEALLARFAMLTPGTPILRLGRSDQQVTGIVREAPTNFCITPATIHRNAKNGVRIVNASYSPSASFAIPFKGLEADQPADELLTLTDVSLGTGYIGREAIAQMATEAKFTVGTNKLSFNSHKIITNHRALAALRADIDTLYQLGMDKVTTKPLDAALVEAQDYHLQIINRRAKILREQLKERY